MADICINNLFATSPDTEALDALRRKIENRFDCFFTGDKYDGPDAAESFEAEFVSDRVFPGKEMEELAGSLAGKPFYMQAISYCREQEYIAFNTYKEGKWTDMLAIGNRNN